MRDVYLTHHTLDQMFDKFPLVDKHYRYCRDYVFPRLVACARDAEDSPYDHVVIGQGFLNGTLKLPGIPHQSVSFAYTKENGRYVICTTLTRQEVVGHGACCAR